MTRPSRAEAGAPAQCEEVVHHVPAVENRLCRNEDEALLDEMGTRAILEVGLVLGM